MPNIGSIVSGSMQTPTTMTRAAGGADVMIFWITPGTPTHSKIAAGRSGGPGSHGGSGGADAGSLHVATSFQLSYGDFSAGSTTTSAPSATASSRRRFEKSAATIGRAFFKRSAAITASPTGPQPTTSGTSFGSSRAFSTA